VNYRQELERRKGQLQAVLDQIDSGEKQLRKLKRKALRLEEAQQIIQAVAQATQKELEFHVSELVSLALASTFEDPYELHVDFTPRRGKTEADITFNRAGDEERKVHPTRASGGGACDVASLALRFSFYSLMAQKPRPVFILDEPFKNINDPSRRLHEAAAEMLREIADKLGIQIIVVTLMPELKDTADKTFRVKLKDGVSIMEEE
jgi:DNA repair exonuclease SbcCD ATPase subunit